MHGLVLMGISLTTILSTLLVLLAMHSRASCICVCVYGAVMICKSSAAYDKCDSLTFQPHRSHVVCARHVIKLDPSCHSSSEFCKRLSSDRLRGSARPPPPHIIEGLCRASNRLKHASHQLFDVLLMLLLLPTKQDSVQPIISTYTQGWV